MGTIVDTSKVINMDFLKAEIERKKKQMKESNILAPNKKYFKRGDLAAKQEEEYWTKHKRLKVGDDYEAGTSAELEVSAGNTESDSEKEDEKNMMPRKEVIRRLRERNEPILCFGETELQAYQRLRKLEIMAPEINIGYKNDMKAAMERVDQQYLQEIMKADGDSEGTVNSNISVVDDGTSIEEIIKMAEKLGTGDVELDCTVILKFLKLLLKMWAAELNSRAEDIKRSFRGKLASATHGQTVSYIKPLFRQLKRKSLPPEILSCIADVIRHMLDRHYLKANDAYLEMAIGNAPWPIGCTMVGIHARTGREKVNERHIAHVLNDETQRKYIQALKRLMTHAQRFFPTDPSRSVELKEKYINIINIVNSSIFPLKRQQRWGPSIKDVH